MPVSKNRWISLGNEPVDDPAPVVADEPSMLLPTGPSKPQLSVPQPDHVDRLPRRSVADGAADYWWLGVHGGAGESSWLAWTKVPVLPSIIGHRPLPAQSSSWLHGPTFTACGQPNVLRLNGPRGHCQASNSPALSSWPMPRAGFLKKSVISPGSWAGSAAPVARALD